jgi:hypothetical protein
MEPNDMTDDPILQTLRELPSFDVRAGRARRLRERCQRSLAGRTAIARARPDDQRTRLTLRVLAGVWCGVYLFETIRRAAAVYGF